MASTSTGGSYPTLIPTLGADANVMDALYFYHFGKDPYTGATDANSIAGHIAAVNTRVDGTATNIGYTGVSPVPSPIHTRLTALETFQNTTAPATYVRLISQTASPNTITPQTIATVPLAINGASGQTANLQEWKVNGTIVARIDASGVLFSAGGGGGTGSSDVGSFFLMGA